MKIVDEQKLEEFISAIRESIRKIVRYENMVNDLYKYLNERTTQIGGNQKLFDGNKDLYNLLLDIKELLNTHLTMYLKEKL